MALALVCANAAAVPDADDRVASAVEANSACAGSCPLARGPAVAAAVPAHPDARADVEPAGDLAFEPDARVPLRAWAVQGGASARSTAVAAAWAWPWPWPLRWPGRALPEPWSLELEASVGGWFARQPQAGDPTHFWRLGLTPVLRYRLPAAAPVDFVEAGIGAHLIGPVYRLGDRRFGSAFNFGDHLAVGWVTGQAGRDEWSLRLQHFSNGGLRPPNPGENFLQLRWARRH